jgi:hypothetical protein
VVGVDRGLELRHVGDDARLAQQRREEQRLELRDQLAGLDQALLELASAWRVTTTLTRYSAVPIDSTASSALARKIRFESEDSMARPARALLRRRRAATRS